MLVPPDNLPISDNLPTFNEYLAVAKNSITDKKIFEDYIALYNLKIVQEEDNHFIIFGDSDDLKEFSYYWSSI